MLRETSNTHANSPISILFHDHNIAALFAELLISMGENIRLIQDITDLEEGDKIITEPQYFSALSNERQQNCLLIGKKASLVGLRAQSISQPLTEEKIVTGLQEFLTTTVH